MPKYWNFNLPYQGDDQADKGFKIFYNWAAQDDNVIDMEEGDDGVWRAIQK